MFENLEKCINTAEHYSLPGRAEQARAELAAVREVYDAAKRVLDKGCMCHSTEDANWHGSRCTIPAIKAAISKLSTPEPLR